MFIINSHMVYILISYKKRKVGLTTNKCESFTQFAKERYLLNLFFPSSGLVNIFNQNYLVLIRLSGVVFMFERYATLGKLSTGATPHPNKNCPQRTRTRSCLCEISRRIICFNGSRIIRSINYGK